MRRRAGDPRGVPARAGGLPRRLPHRRRPAVASPPTSRVRRRRRIRFLDSLWRSPGRAPANAKRRAGSLPISAGRRPRVHNRPTGAPGSRPSAQRAGQVRVGAEAAPPLPPRRRRAAPDALSAGPPTPGSAEPGTASEGAAGGARADEAGMPRSSPQRAPLRPGDGVTVCRGGPTGAGFARPGRPSVAAWRGGRRRGASLPPLVPARPEVLVRWPPARRSPRRPAPQPRFPDSLPAVLPGGAKIGTGVFGSALCPGGREGADPRSGEGPRCGLPDPVRRAGRSPLRGRALRRGPRLLSPTAPVRRAASASGRSAPLPAAFPADRNPVARLPSVRRPAPAPTFRAADR